jgi:hypothetical protein
MLLFLLALLQGPQPHSYFVAPAPAGTARGTGTQSRPWDLKTAFTGAGGRIQPGDTVWLTGGTYQGAFRTQLQGSPGRPIVFRQQRGQRATIDGTLVAEGNELVFWGFEIMQSTPSTYGLEARTNNGKFINLVIHDAGKMGVSFWTPGENAELYGCIIYNNGTHENLDHGIYLHNERGTKRVLDNVIFDNLAYGIHAYAGPGNAPQQGILIRGNIVFNNGTISNRYRAKGNILVGGDVPYSGVDASENYLYFSGSDGVNLRLGYKPVDNDDVSARGNYAWGGETGLLLGTWRRPQLDGNTVIGAKTPLAEAAAGLGRVNITYAGSRLPSAPAVFVRPNLYEPGRAYIVAYNFPSRDTVRADVAGVLRPGDIYELRSVADVFGAPIATGTYSGSPIPLPMREPRLAPPGAMGRGLATTAPPVTRPLFDVFVLTARSATGP